MSSGLETTFGILTRTRNEAAVDALLPALDAKNPEVQERALAAILARRAPAGQKEILRRIPSLSRRWKKIITKDPSGLSNVLRDGIAGADENLCANACRAAVIFRSADLIPTLLAALENPSLTKANMAAETLLQLAAEFENKIAHLPQEEHRYELLWLRKRIIASLEASVLRFGKHRRREALEAFLLIAPSDNLTLRRILNDPHDPGFLIVIEIMSKSLQAGVMNLLLGFLNDHEPPIAAVGAIANRTDVKFIVRFMQAIGDDPTPHMRQTLHRMESIAWLKNPELILPQLDEAGQQNAAKLIEYSSVPRSVGFATVKYLLLHGKNAGRREAAVALEAFIGADANALALKGLADPDPQVQANVINQLRRRKMPGVLPRLVDFLDSPHAAVRRAARRNLDEFSFRRFLGAFEMLDEEVRQTTGELVKKVDPYAAEELRAELEANSHARQVRALQITRYLNLAESVQDLLLLAVKDEDHVVRSEAVADLAFCKSPSAKAALLEALEDRSSVVQDAAKRSLEFYEATAEWRERDEGKTAAADEEKNEKRRKELLKSEDEL